MLGFQEILIIALIIAAGLFLSRMKADKPPPRIIFQRRAHLAGNLRMAIAASVIFILLTAAYFQPWHNDPADFALVGVAPVAVGWLLFWVYRGFKNR